MQRLLLLLILSSGLTGAHAQFKAIEFKLSTYYPLIADLEQSSNVNIIPAPSGSTQYSSVGGFQENYSEKLGFGFESRVMVDLSKKIAISFGIGLQHVKFKRENLIISNNNLDELILRGSFYNNDPSAIGTEYGLIVGQISARDVNGNLIINGGSSSIGASNNPSIDIIYFDIPIGISYNVTKKLEANFGVSLAQRIYSKTKSDIYTFGSNGDFIRIEETITDGRGLNSSQLFLSVGLAYNLWKNIYSSISYKRSMTPIYDNENQFAGKAKYNLFGIGLSYRVFSKPAVKQN